MTITCGFYNSVTGDRVYNAQQMSSIFDGIINDGVFASIGDYFLVTEGTGMQVLVGSGRAWFDHTWTYNDANIALAVTTADALLDRIDVVYLEVNEDSGVRDNKVDILDGTPASTPVPPTLTSTSTVHQYPLAHILVEAGVTEIIPDNITNKVGLEETPFVTGPLSVISTNELLVQWEAEFGTWFDSIKGQLDGEAETLLQNQINAIVGDMNPPLIDLIELKYHDHTTDTPQIPTAGIENDAVDDTKVGDRVIQIYRRQGGNAINWDLEGAINYTPEKVRMQVGQCEVDIADGQYYGTLQVTYPVAFTNKPLVFVSLRGLGTVSVKSAVAATITTTTVEITVVRTDTTGVLALNVNWMAIGQE